MSVYLVDFTNARDNNQYLNNNDPADDGTRQPEDTAILDNPYTEELRGRF
jgi:hypothetical protein